MKYTFDDNKCILININIYLFHGYGVRLYKSHDCGPSRIPVIPALDFKEGGQEGGQGSMASSCDIRSQLSSTIWGIVQAVPGPGRLGPRLPARLGGRPAPRPPLTRALSPVSRLLRRGSQASPFAAFRPGQGGRPRDPGTTARHPVRTRAPHPLCVRGLRLYPPTLLWRLREGAEEDPRSGS